MSEFQVYHLKSDMHITRLETVLSMYIEGHSHQQRKKLKSRYCFCETEISKARFICDQEKHQISRLSVLFDSNTAVITLTAV